MASWIASRVSVSVPIWLTLIRIELATPSSMPLARIAGLVTNRSSPTSWTFVAQRLGQQPPAVPVALGHAVLDRDDRELARTGPRASRTMPVRVERLALAVEMVACRP